MFYDNNGHTCRAGEEPKPLSSTPQDDKQAAPIAITISPPTPDPGSRANYHQQYDFDALFANPRSLFRSFNQSESVDEGIYSFDEDKGGRPYEHDSVFLPVPTSPAMSHTHSVASLGRLSHTQSVTSIGRISRVDSVMEQSFVEMMTKNKDNSGGLGGFRRRMAQEISHKYCSYCRCDEMLFVFVYVVFGMAYITAGLLGLSECPHEQYVNLFLVTDGVLSVFVFPISVMEWAQRIGGCVREDAKIGRGVYFIIIIVMRLAAAIAGTALIIYELDIIPHDDVICWSVFTLLEIGVSLEWAFIMFALLLPYIMYVCLYVVANRKLKKGKKSEEAEHHQHAPKGGVKFSLSADYDKLATHILHKY